jgi:hypothetical protein
MKFKILYGLGGGFGGTDEDEPQEIVEFSSQKRADSYAWEKACEEYEMYDGLHGLRNVDMIMEEDEVDEDGAYEIYCEERESWLEYQAIPVKE